MNTGIHRVFVKRQRRNEGIIQIFWNSLCTRPTLKSPVIAPRLDGVSTGNVITCATISVTIILRKL